MFIMFARFDFRSADLESENKNYRENHVKLARQLPGVRMYLTGKLLATPQGGPDRYRAVVFIYDSPEIAARSLDCPAGAEMMADSAAHITGTVVDGFEGDRVVPFDQRTTGQLCFMMARAFDLKSEAGFEGYQNAICGLQGLRGYFAGRTQPAREQKPERTWMEIALFENRAAFDKAFSGELGKAEQALMLSPRVYFLDGRVEI